MSAFVDELVEQCYSAPIASFSPAPSPKAPLWNTIPIVGEDDPADALKQYSDREGWWALICLKIICCSQDS